MAANQEMVARRKAEWGDQVRVIGLSTDTKLDLLQNHVKEKGWTDVEHYWAKNGTSNADQIYAKSGIPFNVLVDKSGKIVFMGHADDRKFEEDIDALVRGEKISGKGTVRESELKKEGQANFVEISNERYVELTSFFQEGCQSVLDEC